MDRPLLQSRENSFHFPELSDESRMLLVRLQVRLGQFRASTLLSCFEGIARLEGAHIGTHFCPAPSGERSGMVMPKQAEHEG